MRGGPANEVRGDPGERSSYTLYNFLQDKFSRVSSSSAGQFCEKIGKTSRTKVADIDHATAEKLFKELQDSKLPPPPTDCARMPCAPSPDVTTVTSRASGARISK